MTKKIPVLCTTLLVETSPQSIPLGAACIASAINSSALAEKNVTAFLKSFSLEDPSFINCADINEKGKLLAQNILSELSSFSLSENTFPSALVCFSVFVWNTLVIQEAARLIKSKNSSIILLAGGPEVTASPASFTAFDWCVTGEGEVSVLEFLNQLLVEKKSSEEINVQGFSSCKKNLLTLENKTRLSSPYFGLKGDKPSFSSPVRSCPPLLENLSSPWLDGTLDPNQYGGVLWELARGCPFKCSYCYESKGEKKIQFFPMERIKAELELFGKKNVCQAFVLDPTYNADKKRALEIISLIKEKAPNMFFYFEARAEYIDSSLARAFASIPCSLQIGLQSSNEEVLKKVHRSMNKKLFVKNIGLLNKEGAVFGFDLIYGLPSDSLKGFEDSIDFALSLYPNNLELFCLSVLPGTLLFEEAEGLGLTWQKNPPYHVVSSPTFSEKEIEKAEKLSRAVKFFYTQGRAVPWFMSLLFPLHIKPSAFFKEFVKYAEENKIDTELCDFEKIMKIQNDFLAALYRQKKLEKYIPLIQDIVNLNGALSMVTSDGKESIVFLHYHPDDLMSEYACDLAFFHKNARKMQNRTRVFASKNGPDWKKL